jgi:hypothetical protein
VPTEPCTQPEAEVPGAPVDGSVQINVSKNPFARFQEGNQISIDFWFIKAF